MPNKNHPFFQALCFSLVPLIIADFDATPGSNVGVEIVVRDVVYVKKAKDDTVPDPDNKRAKELKSIKLRLSRIEEKLNEKYEHEKKTDHASSVARRMLEEHQVKR